MENRIRTFTTIWKKLTENGIHFKISHEVRNLADEMFYSEAAASLMKLLARTRQNPDLKNVREISIGEKGILLYLVSRPEGVPSGELSRALGIGSGGVANLLSVLDRKEYISRSISPKDRRIIIVSITEAGRKAITDLRCRIQTRLEDLLKALGEDDTRELIRIYERIVRISRDGIPSAHSGQEGA